MFIHMLKDEKILKYYSKKHLSLKNNVIFENLIKCICGK